MEPVVVLRSQSAHHQAGARIRGNRVEGLVGRIIAVQKVRNGEPLSLDPKLLGSIHALECREAAVCRAGDDCDIIGSGDWAGSGREFTREEVVEALGSVGTIDVRTHNVLCQVLDQQLLEWNGIRLNKRLNVLQHTLSRLVVNPALLHN